MTRRLKNLSYIRSVFPTAKGCDAQAVGFFLCIPVKHATKRDILMC